MSDSPDVSAAAAHSPADGQEPNSTAAAGAMLRRARESAGLHVAQLATALKVPVSKLEALEAGRIDLLPDITFARGLAASISRGLKIDPKPVLDLMPTYAETRRVVAPPAINARFQPAGGDSPSLRRPSPALLAVLILLLGALAIFLFPDKAPAPSAGAPVAAVPDAAEMSSVPASAPLDLPAPAVLEPAPAASAVAAAASAAASAATSASAAAATPSAPASAPASDLLVVRAHAESWLQVTDAKGASLVRRTLQAGETVGATGELPLAVVVGRIDAVQIDVRGKLLDLSSIAVGNVARFEVK